MRRIHQKPLFITALLALTALAAFLLSRSSIAQDNARPSATITRWEYTLVRLEGPNKAEASVAVLNRYGAEGWEAVELLPPAYDILLKRPAGR